MAGCKCLFVFLYISVYLIVVLCISSYFVVFHGISLYFDVVYAQMRQESKSRFQNPPGSMQESGPRERSETILVQDSSRGFKFKYFLVFLRISSHFVVFRRISSYFFVSHFVVFLRMSSYFFVFPRISSYLIIFLRISSYFILFPCIPTTNFDEKLINTKENTCWPLFASGVEC